MNDYFKSLYNIDPVQIPPPKMRDGRYESDFIFNLQILKKIFNNKI